MSVCSEKNSCYGRHLRLLLRGERIGVLSSEGVRRQQHGQPAEGHICRRRQEGRCEIGLSCFCSCRQKAARQTPYTGGSAALFPVRRNRNDVCRNGVLRVARMHVRKYGVRHSAFFSSQYYYLFITLLFFLHHIMIVCTLHYHYFFITLRLFVHYIILLSSFHYPAALMTVFPVASVAHVQPEYAVLSPALNQQLVERQVVAYVGSHFHGS